MHKDELLELHEQMVLIMEYFRSQESVDASLFDPYDELDVEPDHVHKSKASTNTRCSSSATPSPRR
jgi:Predicted metal-binding protein